MEQKRGRGWRKTAIYTVLLILALFFFLPYLWMISTALKSNQEVVSQNLTLIPRNWHWENFVNAWESANFGRMFLNSFIMAFTVTIGQIFTSVLAGYAFARLQFVGKKTLFLILLSTLVIPFQMLVIPVFIMLMKVGWIDTYLALIVPSLANAFGIFLFRQFFMSIPYSVEEAAYIDGASRWTILWRIMFPLARPASVTLFLFTFIAEWNDLFKPLVFTQSESMRTVQFGLTVFQEQFSTNYTLLMAASILVTVPVLLLFLVGQKQFIKGIASTGGK
ncbi:carbohydrate ABC transporter permease [Microaerobacter geothermalis]|uniref:carbohydrate ABC transporter permease n=1 Tax=Microaerobacter geothermalis TaxID=674972 RepID=UPI001F3E2EA7|nr:carbohydrate ABC transporter permease [Microaerobacter geothermalis]MCF6094247.1 carbohydrate ABC transporter permease [Microaerobacter geothermalis]